MVTCEVEVCGKWKDNLKYFFFVTLLIDDGPTKNLMDIMGEHGFKAPSDWAGYRYDGGGHWIILIYISYIKIILKFFLFLF